MRRPEKASAAGAPTGSVARIPRPETTEFPLTGARRAAYRLGAFYPVDGSPRPVGGKPMRGLGTFLVAAGLALLAQDGHAAFTTFESGHVRPIAMSPDGSRLFAVNTPDDYLEVFTVSSADGALVHEASIPVGLE